MWRTAVVKANRAEAVSARTLVLAIHGWPGHLAGQHIEVRRRTVSGELEIRSYSLAAPARGDCIEITVRSPRPYERMPLLSGNVAVGEAVELRGPIGEGLGWGSDEGGSALLLAGGSGIVPLMAMIRSRSDQRSDPYRLVHSVRRPADRIFQGELERLADEDEAFGLRYVYTREGPDGDDRVPRRVRLEDLDAAGLGPELDPVCFICGPDGFVETVTRLLLARGHDPARIRTPTRRHAAPGPE